MPTIPLPHLIFVLFILSSRQTQSKEGKRLPEIDIQRENVRDRHTETEIYREKDKQTERQRQTDKQRLRQKEIEDGRKKEGGGGKGMGRRERLQ